MADDLEILQLKLYLYEFSNVLARLNSTLFLLKAKWNLLFHFSVRKFRFVELTDTRFARAVSSGVV